MEPKPIDSESEPKITLKLCSEEDLEILNKVIPSPGYHEERLRGQEAGNNSYIIAWRDGVPVGHLNLKWQGSDQPEVKAYVDVPELNAIGVEPPELRSKGIGRKLIEFAEALAKTKGYTQIGLGVAVDNPRAKQLYERLGYKDWGHGIYHDRWIEKDNDGTTVEHDDPCHYLVKELLYT